MAEAAIAKTARLSRVLFADDDAEVRRAVARCLRSRGFIVDVAADGLEALSLANEYPYAVVATDHQMPGLSGLELISSLRRLQANATFVMVTGLRNVARQANQTPGVAGVIIKPWRDDELVRLIEDCIDQANRRAIARSAETFTSLPSPGPFALLLEDNDLDARVLEQAISGGETNRYRIIRARCLVEACRLLRTREYAVVLADLGLPDADELAAVSELHAVSPATPILVMTSADDEAQAIRAMQAGAQDYLLKGRYDADNVQRAIRYAIERKRLEHRLSELAHFDSLTGTASRFLMTDRQQQAMARAARSGKSCALLLVDLDHFKSVNDTFGHAVGDRVLIEASRRLTSSTREEDTLARIGGDEFAVLIEAVDDFDQPRRVAQRILNAFETPLVVDDNVLPVTPSIGIALYPDHAETMNDLTKRADAALYSAKSHGKNTYQVFGENVHADLSERRAFESQLAEAVEQRRFRLEYQPVFDLTSGTCRGHEALLRWDYAGKPRNAHDFMAVLEERGDMVRVGQWVLDRVCDAVLSQNATPGPISINVSAREFAYSDFVGRIERKLLHHGLAGRCLQLELRETTLFRHLSDTTAKLSRLAALGVSVAVDDYGVGRSSLWDLSTLPIGTVKLHDSFVRELDKGRRQVTLRALLASSKALGWSVVAKGVETQAQLDFLKSEACPLAQGFLFGAPAVFD